MNAVEKRVLFVTPCTHSSGEAVTAMHVALDLAERGIVCWFAAAAGAASMLPLALRDRVVVLGASREANQARWNEAIVSIAPRAIVFADYPLLFFTSGAAPLADAPWVETLERFGGPLFTMDHIGYAQRRQPVFFGPPHLTFGAEVTVELPRRMEILLPCPTHEPGAVPGRRGTPARYWARPASEAIRPSDVRRRFLDEEDGGVLVLHSTPGWATRLAAQLGLPHYRFLPALLQHYLAGLDAPVTIVAVNDGSMPTPAPQRGVRFVPLPPLPPPEYEALLLAADLAVTDNAVSASLGKAVCAMTPCALLRNTIGLGELLERAPQDQAAAIAIAIENERPGAVFPYDVFPVWDERALDGLGFDYGGSYGRGFARLEAFGGSATRDAFAALLFDPQRRAQLRSAQRDYATALAALPSMAEAILARIGAE